MFILGVSKFDASSLNLSVYVEFLQLEQQSK